MPALAVPLIAIGVWWNSNTVAHYFVHRPFFRHRAGNYMFGAILSVLLGIPQRLWRERHLAHHAGVAPRLLLSAELFVQAALVAAMWCTLLVLAPRFFLFAYLPGYLAGLGLCALHGHYEHAGGGATSHYGRLYNLLTFNDGYHAEHHAYPRLAWHALPSHRGSAEARVSSWPAPLRFLEGVGLDGLERLVLRSRLLQRFVVGSHERAMRALLAGLGPVERIGIVGGGLFPRTALVLGRLLPDARLTIIDADRANLDRARAMLNGLPIEYRHARYSGARTESHDLLIVPLAYRGDREAIYSAPPAAAVLVHDWIWRPRGTTRLVSVFLGKRLNLVRR